jgi:hypothetical protein
MFFKANRTGPWTCHFCGSEIDDCKDVNIHHLDESKSRLSIRNMKACHRKCHVKWHADRQPEEKRQKITLGVARSWVGARVLDI